MKKCSTEIWKLHDSTHRYTDSHVASEMVKAIHEDTLVWRIVTSAFCAVYKYSYLLTGQVSKAALHSYQQNKTRFSAMWRNP